MRLAPTIVAIVLAVVACDSFEADTTPPSCEADLASDPANCGACGTRCDVGSTCEGGACRVGCRDRILHVSADGGNDGNDGCTPGTAIRTISAAIGLASTRRLEGHEIHVCAGTYAESGLHLDYPISIRGGYNCVTWTRGDRFGRNGNFEDPNSSRITIADYPTHRTTFTIAGKTMGPGAIVEGLTISGAASGASGSIALAVLDGASPTLSELLIQGGSTENTREVGATAVYFERSSPELASSRVLGGPGKVTASPGIGSIAVLVVGGQPNIHDNFIDAGDGRGVTGGFGIRIQAGNDESTKVTLRSNAIRWRSPVSANSDDGGAGGGAVAAVQAIGVVLEAERNTIVGSKARCLGQACVALGLHLIDAKASKLLANVVYMGELDVADNVAAPTLAAIRVDGEGTTQIEGNLVHAGGSRSSAQVIPAGIDLAAGTGHVVRANTVIAVGAGPALGFGLRVGANASATKDVHVIGNLFIGAESTSTGIILRSCGGSTVARIESNVFLGTTTTMLDAAGGSCAATAYAYPTQMEAAFGSPGTNRAIRAGCSSPSCIPNTACSDLETCARHVFAKWEATSAGGAVILGAGLRLREDGRCAVNEGGGSLPMSLARDLYGEPRTAPFSVGALEAASCVK